MKAVSNTTPLRYLIAIEQEHLLGQAPEGATAMSKKRKSRKNHMGSSIEDFLKEEGIFEESQAQAIKEVVAWQLEEAGCPARRPKL
jgi:hypothetical protein